MAKIPETLNGNTLAKYVTQEEGGKESLGIAQVKEVIGIMAKVAYKRPVEFLNLMYRLGKK